VIPRGRSSQRTLWHPFAAAAIAVVLFACDSARASELPDAATLLGSLGFTPAQITQVQAGQFVRGRATPGSDRELAVLMAFQVPLSPTDLMSSVKSGLLDRVDANTTSGGVVPDGGGIADFARLVLQPDAQRRANAYVTATPGGALHLSTGEIAAFQGLGTGAPIAAVEQEIRSALLARLQAYRSQGLAGIAPYALARGQQRDVGGELRIANRGLSRLEPVVPAALRLLRDYPRSKPPGTEETFRWSQFEANRTPTIAITHVLLVPDGDAWIVVQRQFYVSTGYNSVQATAAFLPAKGGTVVVYGNRTSTDQVAGLGGSARRSIGARMLGTELEALLEKARAAAR